MSNASHPTAPYLNLNRTQLLIRLGASALAEGESHLENPSVRESIEAAKQWFGQHYETIKKAVCTRKDVLTSKGLNAAAAVFDVITSVLGGVPVTFAAIYVADYGLDKFCKTGLKEFKESMDEQPK
jgi:hypothetical protein